MSYHLTESEVEELALDILAEQSYKIVHDSDIAPGCKEW